MFDASVVYIGIKILADRFCEEFAEVGAVVAKQWRDGFELDIVLVIVVNIVEDIIKNGIS